MKIEIEISNFETVFTPNGSKVTFAPKAGGEARILDGDGNCLSTLFEPAIVVITPWKPNDEIDAAKSIDHTADA